MSARRNLTLLVSLLCSVSILVSVPSAGIYAATAKSPVEASKNTLDAKVSDVSKLSKDKITNNILTSFKLSLSQSGYSATEVNSIVKAMKIHLGKMTLDDLKERYIYLLIGNDYFTSINKSSYSSNKICMVLSLFTRGLDSEVNSDLIALFAKEIQKADQSVQRDVADILSDGYATASVASSLASYGIKAKWNNDNWGNFLNWFVPNATKKDIESLALKFRNDEIEGSDEIREVQKQLEEYAVVEDYPKESKVLNINDRRKYTFLTYLCGSDLESNGGEATYAFAQMLASSPDSNVKIIVCAGGSTKWSSEYLNSKLGDVKMAYFEIIPSAVKDKTITTGDGKVMKAIDVITSGNKYLDDLNNAYNAIINSDSVKLLNTPSQVSMAETATFENFLNFASTNYPADDYGLVLWNHGGGVSEGICYTEVSSNGVIKKDYLKSADLHDAIKNSGVGSLSLLGFDACLMGGADLDLTLQDCYRYMIASEEIEVGGWEYTGIINTINQYLRISKDSEYISKNVADGAFALLYDNHLGNHLMGSNCVFDTKKISNFEDSINILFGDIVYEWPDLESKNRVYAIIRKTTESCYNLGNGKNPDDGYEYWDYGQFLNYLYTNLTKEYNKADIGTTYKKYLDTLLNDTYAALDSGFITSTGLGINGESIITKSVSEGVITPNMLKGYDYSDVWKELKYDAKMYGASLYLPCFTTEIDKSLNAYINTIKDYLADYQTFLRDYVAWTKKNVPTYTDQYDQLYHIDYKALFEQAAAQGGEKAVSVYDNGIYTVSLLPNSKYDSSNCLNATGDSTTDFLNSLQSMDIVITEKKKVGDKDIDIIIAKQPVETSRIAYNEAEDQLSVNVLDREIHKAIAYVVSGHVGAQTGNEQTKDWAMPSNGDVNEVITTLNSKGTDYSAADITIFEGSTVGDILVFKYDPETSWYLYVGKGEYNTDGKFVLHDNAETVSFMHYAVNTETHSVDISSTGILAEYSEPQYKTDSALHIYKELLDSTQSHKDRLIGLDIKYNDVINDNGVFDIALNDYVTELVTDETPIIMSEAPASDTDKKQRSPEEAKESDNNEQTNEQTIEHRDVLDEENNQSENNTEEITESGEEEIVNELTECNKGSLNDENQISDVSSDESDNQDDCSLNESSTKDVSTDDTSSEDTSLDEMSSDEIGDED